MFSTDESRAGVEIIKNAGVALKQAKRLTRGKSLYFKTIKVALRAIVFTYSTSYAAPLPSSSNLYYQPFVRLADKK